MKLHNETVSPQLTRCLKKIMQSDIFKDFNLVGGTCLSLQLGHRRSIDIDLFTSHRLRKHEYHRHESFLARKLPIFRKLRQLRPVSFGLFCPHR